MTVTAINGQRAEKKATSESGTADSRIKPPRVWLNGGQDAASGGASLPGWLFPLRLQDVGRGETMWHRRLGRAQGSTQQNSLKDERARKEHAGPGMSVGVIWRPCSCEGRREGRRAAAWLFHRRWWAAVAGAPLLSPWSVGLLAMMRHGDAHGLRSVCSAARSQAPSAAEAAWAMRLRSPAAPSHRRPASEGKAAHARTLARLHAASQPASGPGIRPSDRQHRESPANGHGAITAKGRRRPRRGSAGRQPQAAPRRRGQWAVDCRQSTLSTTQRRPASQQ